MKDDFFRANPISLDPDIPLYQQLYTHLQTAVLTGDLKPGMRLPSTRALAILLNVSRHTVLNAYQQLLAEGYLDGMVGNGTFVARVLSDPLLTLPPRKDLVETSLGEPNKPRFSEQATLQLTAPRMPMATPDGSGVSPRPFLFGTPALRSFPYKVWSRLLIRQVRRLPASAFPYQHAAGYLYLREAIAAHAMVSRGVHCTPEQIYSASSACITRLDHDGRVIYIGTFSKVLFPALRLGYLIPPSHLVAAFRTVRNLIDTHPPILEQAVLAEFIGEGHFTRHLRKMRSLYAERRAALLEAAREINLEIHPPEAGIHCIGWLPEGMDALALAREATNQGVDIAPVSHFSIEPLARNGILLGYSDYSVEQIQDGMRRLAMAMDSI